MSQELQKLEGVGTFPLKQNPDNQTLAGDAFWIKIAFQMRWAPAIYIPPFLAATWQLGEIIRQDHKQQKQMARNLKVADCSNVEKVMAGWTCAQNGSGKNYMQSYVGCYTGNDGAQEGNTVGRRNFETGCEDGRWMELAQDRVQFRALVLSALNLRVLLPENYFRHLKRFKCSYGKSLLMMERV
jgi:hypothetical protein